MRNLAGVACDADVRAELLAAGIPLVDRRFPSTGEVATRFEGFLCGWVFERAWVYWRAKAQYGGSLDLETAEAFHQEWGQQVRASGHCACPSPREQWPNSWERADSYHIDTPAGLHAFAELLKRRHPDWREGTEGCEVFEEEPTLSTDPNPTAPTAGVEP
jgi:hypothetical protein